MLTPDGVVLWQCVSNDYIIWTFLQRKIGQGTCCLFCGAVMTSGWPMSTLSRIRSRPWTRTVRGTSTLCGSSISKNSTSGWTKKITSLTMTPMWVGCLHFFFSLQSWCDQSIAWFRLCCRKLCYFRIITAVIYGQY